ncbi:MAG TPA: NAD(P)/FAD-dependent oxidoreductase [Methylovirgula sp.]
MEQFPNGKKVVIVGGGFGGLAAAHALRNLPIEITIIDRQNHHLFQPLLYQVATALVSPADIAWPIRAVMRGQHNVRVMMTEVTSVDVDAKIVHTDSVDVPYDYLILATGATHSYFGHDEWAQYAPGLKTIFDATEIRGRLLLAFEHAELATDAAARKALLTFVIVGGGPTGVETAGSIAEVALHALPDDFCAIDPRKARILLVEASPRVLPSFPENLSKYAARALTKMGVDVMTNSRVTDCDASGVIVNGERINAGTVVWAAGVVASPAAKWVGAPHDSAGRAIVERDLSVPGHKDIFVIGDTASVMRKNGEAVPGIAPAAKQMGRYVGKLIRRDIENKPRPTEAFVYHHQGDLATIGTHSAVVKLNFDHLTLKGFLGWLFWSVAHIYFLIGFRNRFVVAISWIYGIFTSRRGARIIALPDHVQDAKRADVLAMSHE